MKTKNTPTVYLKDYLPPVFLVSSVKLIFHLHIEQTKVFSEIRFHKNPKMERAPNKLILNGENIQLINISLDEKQLSEELIILTNNTLILNDVPDEFTLNIETNISPISNKALEGLFITNKKLCTQCEAEGFRRITFYPDRPDILSTFVVTLIAEKKDFPVLLSNGNCIEKGLVDNTKHYTVWEDPFPKPSYLFAIVAGDLNKVQRQHFTKTGKEIQLSIYMDHGKETKGQYALNCLERAIEWDERVYGREYDLSEFNIVAVADFNMGAMENKSLNIFNDKFILADPDTATDIDYENIESVVAHEYFHNWSGNRVTCRDWFQLSLKEGLTVYRDQQFSAEQRSSEAQRIKDVKQLRAIQFAEDSGPLSHPVQPSSYSEINNFYTATVYEKGAEVVRMINHLIGKKYYRNGMDQYFTQYDGQAVTCEKFVKTMAEASGFDFGQFMLWYTQAGTPAIDVTVKFSPDKKLCSVTFTQTNNTSNHGVKNQPMCVPIAIGFINSNKGQIETILNDNSGVPVSTHKIVLRKKTTVINFTNFPDESSPPVITLNRNFTAPIKLNIKRKNYDLTTIMKLDPDLFSRWDAAQNMALRVITNRINGNDSKDALATFLEAVGFVLAAEYSDLSAKAEILKLPTEAIVKNTTPLIEPIKTCDSINWLSQQMIANFFDHLFVSYKNLETDEKYSPSHAQASQRSLKNTLLQYLSWDNDRGLNLAYQQYKKSNNMTDRLCALQALNNHKSPLRDNALKDFHDRYCNDSLVLDKWLFLEASHPYRETLDRVKTLLSHNNFNIENPNKIRSLLGAFANSNATAFHQTSGEGYKFIADQVIIIDQFNPQASAKLAGAFQQWRRHENSYSARMKNQLTRIANIKKLSKNLNEIVIKSLEVS